jgi:hypothetical protein
MLMIRQIIKPDDGLVGIIVTILIIGLIIVVTGIIQLVYVPQWLEQKEADHMHIVSYQFTQLKHSLDILSVVEQKNAISTYITLGMTDIPIIGNGRTYDSLEILSDTCGVEISNETDLYSFSLGVIKYSSGNSYFVDQSYIYEAGALILSQSNASMLNGQPFLSVSNYTNVSFTIINISGLEGKKFAGGYGTYSLYMEYLNSTFYTIDNFRFINITTNYQNAWRLFFNNTNLRFSGLTYEIKDTSDGISIEFSGSLGNLILKNIEISTQIAPGWIE